MTKTKATRLGGILVPGWNSVTHDAVFRQIAAELDLYPVVMPRAREMPRGLLARGLALAAIHVPRCIFLWRLGRLRSLRVRGVNLGHSVNEESIMLSRYAVPDAGMVIRLCAVALIRLVYLSRAMSDGRIRMVLGGDEAYTTFSIAAQLARKYGIPCHFLKGAWEVRRHDFDEEHLTAYPPFERLAQRAGEWVGKELLREAEVRLARQCAGQKAQLGYMADSKWSAFTPPAPAFVAIYLHDFYDSPGVYGANLFSSHYAWVKRSVRILVEHGTAVLLKRHPNERPMNRAALARLHDELGSAVTWLEDDVALETLKLSGCRAILTVYGTVIYEAGYAGIPVVAAGRSPASGFGISHQAATLAEYSQLLPRAADGKLSPARRDDVLRAYAMNFILRWGLPTAADIPFDDLSPALWAEICNDSRPSSNYERRAAFLRRGDLAAAVRRSLEGRNVAAELGIDTVPSRWETTCV